MKYLSSLELKALSEEDLDDYSVKMMDKQMDILDEMDKWSDYYYLIADEYTRRKAGRCTIIQNESTTRH